MLHVDLFKDILFSTAYENARLPLPYMHGHDERALESCLQCAAIKECLRRRIDKFTLSYDST